MKDLNIKVRYAQNKDLAKIIKLGIEMKELKVSNSGRFYDKDELKDLIKRSKGNIFLVATYRNIIVGLLYAKIISKNWCMLDTIGIKKGYRRKNFATNILEHLYKVMKKNNISYLQAVVGVEYKNARQFYKANGFRECKKLIWIEKEIK